MSARMSLLSLTAEWIIALLLHCLLCPVALTDSDDVHVTLDWADVCSKICATQGSDSSTSCLAMCMMADCADSYQNLVKPTLTKLSLWLSRCCPKTTDRPGNIRKCATYFNPRLLLATIWYLEACACRTHTGITGTASVIQAVPTEPGMRSVESEGRETP